MAHGTTVKVVESAVRSLNDKAEALGWSRRYEFHKGNAATGVQHALVTRVPESVLAIHREPIGNTLNKAHRYVNAMAQVLNDALLERASARAGVMTGRGTTAEHRVLGIDPGRTVGIHDPNARSLRPGEG